MASDSGNQAIPGQTSLLYFIKQRERNCRLQLQLPFIYEAYGTSACTWDFTPPVETVTSPMTSVYTN